MDVLDRLALFLQDCALREFDFPQVGRKASQLGGRKRVEEQIGSAPNCAREIHCGSFFPGRVAPIPQCEPPRPSARIPHPVG
jgi:hypothetical protein